MITFTKNRLPKMLLYPGDRKLKINGKSPINWWIVLAFLFGLLAGKAFGAPAIPAYASEVAWRDWKSRGQNPFIFYLWSPTASSAQYNAAVIDCNIALNQGSVEYKPPTVANGALIVLDLAQLVDSTKQLDRLLKLMLSLAPKEAYFSQHLLAVQHGKESKQEIVTTPAPYTANALGIGRIWRVDQFTKLVTSSADDGEYLQFRGLVAGKTKLDDYLASRGIVIKNGTNGSEDLNAVDEVLMVSNLNEKVRVVELGHSRSPRPSLGRPLWSMTKDVLNGPLDPNKNAFKSVFNNDFDAFEVIVTLPSGYQEFTLWNGKGVLLAEANQDVVTDSTTPPFTSAVLQEAVGCLRCHGPHDGLQPIQTQQRIVLQPDGRLTNEQGTITFLADIGKVFHDPLQANRTMLGRFGASQHDLDKALNDAREGLNTRFDVTAENPIDPVLGIPNPHSCKVAYADYSSVYNAYVVRVTPAAACQELGFEAAKNPGDTLRAIEPVPKNIVYSTGSANTLGQLEAGHAVTRDDFELAFSEMETQAMAVLKASAMQKNPKLNLSIGNGAPKL